MGGKVRFSVLQLHMSESENIAESIQAYLNGNSNDVQLRQVIHVLQEPHENLYLRTLLLELWERDSYGDRKMPDPDGVDYPGLLAQIHRQIAREEMQGESVRVRKANIWRMFSKVASVLFLPLLITTLWYASRDHRTPPPSTVVLQTPLGSKTKTTLPDGTEVWQNSGSSLSYSSTFSKGDRVVFLSGEAFFNVKADEDHPFYVQTEQAVVRVTGTKFNVSAYDDDTHTSVVLESGKLTFQYTGTDSPPLTLLPGDRVIFDLERKQYRRDRPSLEKITSWRHGRLVFRNDPLELVAKKLSRWYNADISIAGSEGPEGSEKLASHPFTLTIENETLPEVLNYLSRAAPIEFEVLQGHNTTDKSFYKPTYIIKVKDND